MGEQEALDLGDVPSVPVRMGDVADWTLPVGSPASSSRAPAARVQGAARKVSRPDGRVVATSSLLLWQVLTSAYTRVGFDVLGDEAFRAMVLARIIEPTSKADALRVLAEIGAPAPSPRTLFRSPTRCREGDYRDAIAKACTKHRA